MDLLAALAVCRGERVALVGGGGKTGLAYRLVAEASRQGWTAVFTTTTKLLSPADGAEAFAVGRPDAAALRRQMHAGQPLFLARRWLDEWEETPAGRQRKVGGFAPEEVDDLAVTLKPDLLVVEADGARHRPLKAPADYEPVVPAGTTLLAVVAGLSVLGRPLDESWVHRPERVAALTGITPGQALDEESLVALLAHPLGGLKGCPPGARVAAVLTQAAAEHMPAGRRVARRLLAVGSFDRALLVDLEQAAAEVWTGDPTGQGPAGPRGALPIHAVVLAAGASRRMGRNKLLLPLRGHPLLAHAVDAALGSRAAVVWVVLGAQGQAVRRALGLRPVRFLHNAQWAQGRAASLHTALAKLPPWSEGLLFLAGDMPLVSAAHLDRLLERLRPGVAVVWSGYQGTRGIPALFGREAFAALGQLQGDAGGQALADRFAEEVVPADWNPLDVDTPADYEEACRWPG